MAQEAEDELSQLYKGNAGLIDALAELKVQVVAAFCWSSLHVPSYMSECSFMHHQCGCFSCKTC